jgi:hypothetical protein
MRTIRLMIFSIIFAMTACGPTEPIVNPSNPTIERSVVPTIEKAKDTMREASSKLNDQTVIISELGTDADKALEYSKYIRLYTSADERGVKLSDGLDHSLISIKDHQAYLIGSNDSLVNDMIKSSDALQEAIELGMLKDEESAKWKKTSQKKDQFILELNSRLSDEISKSTNLRLDLEDAQVYKRIIIAIGVMAFLFAVIKAALTIWSPFSRFKV